MSHNFLIVLFKNKNRQKIIKKFITRDNAIFFFKQQSSIDEPFFPMIIENGQNVRYELALLEKNGTKKISNARDEFGRNVDSTIIDSEYVIIDIKKFHKPEYVYDFKHNMKITFESLISKESKVKDLKSVYRLNNKIIFQNDDSVSLYSCKSIDESLRFLKELQRYCIQNKRLDFLISEADDSATKKQLYNLLTSKGFDKKVLYRQYTTYPKDR